ncbi:sensor histidine kinase [Novosphingobium pituita]|nr:ATP-binding protein [Novosphingobium sp. IK01]
MRRPDRRALPNRALSSGAFRFAGLMAGISALGSMLLLVAVAMVTNHAIAEGLSDAVATETGILVGEDRELGRAELVRAIARHTRAVHDHAFRYLLVDRAGKRLAGTLPLAARRVGWGEVEIVTHAGRVRVLANGVTLADGAVLVVGGDMEDLRQLRDELIGFTALWGGGIVLLALVGGLWAGTVFLRRLDQTNEAIDRIVKGALSERLPRFGISPEFDRLTANLNTMLERIDGLVAGLRQVSVDVAHDLRTPLTRLRHRIEGLLDQPEPGPGDRVGLEDQVAACLAQIDEIIRIFSSLLRIAALENHEARAHFAPVDLSALLARLGAVYGPAVEDEGRHLHLALDEGVCAEGDGDLLAQAITNLIENATRHTPAGSRITVRLLRPEQAASGPVVVVEDDGPGVPEDQRERVLQRFVRLDASRSTPGSGLGLALVAAIVRLHGGDLRLEDGDEGTGTKMGRGLRVVIRLAGRGLA